MTNYAQLLNDHSLKATFQRTQILEVIEKYGHIAIDKIYDEVSRIHASLSLATIYKNIILMVEKGVLTEVPISGMKSRYEIKKHEHLHLVCTSCGKVTDKTINHEVMENTTSIANSSGFALEHRQLNLYGVCSDCK